MFVGFRDFKFTGIKYTVQMSLCYCQWVTIGIAILTGQCLALIPDMSQCGITKGCFSNPSTCDTGTCNTVVTWQYNSGDDYVTIELYATRNPIGWVGLGLSLDKDMGDDSVSACVNAGNVSIYQYFTHDTEAAYILSSQSFGMIPLNTGTNGSSLYCTFNRSVSAPSSGSVTDKQQFYSANQAYYLLLGVGPTSEQYIRQHYDNPLVSTDQVNLTQDVVYIGAELDPTIRQVQAHGILMMGSWLMCISISLIIARYYKGCLGGFKLCNKDIWFVIHVTLNSLCLTMTVTAFIIIFIYAGDYSGNEGDGFQRAHPIIGIIVTGLVIINPIMSIFRCEPQAPKRLIFNISHWMVGTAAHILAVVNLFLGIQYTESETFTDSYVLGLLIAFVVVHCSVVIALELIERCCKKEEQNNEFELAANGMQNTTKHSVLQNTMRIKQLLLALYVCFNVAIFIAIVVALATLN